METISVDGISITQANRLATMANLKNLRMENGYWVADDSWVDDDTSKVETWAYTISADNYWGARYDGDL